MKAKVIHAACKKHKYILIRFESGHLMGINCKVASILEERGEYHPEKETIYIGFIPCDINEYITNKHPFMRSN